MSTATLEHVEEIRLNIGAGEKNPAGYTPIDRKLGSEAFPLAYAENSVDEIRSVHMLEHVSHRQTRAVLTDWVRALKPGGRLRVSVPDAKKWARALLNNAAGPLQEIMMGGHIDDDDHHGAVFTEDALAQLFIAVGLERIGQWQSDFHDCSAYSISLNLEGYKPVTDQQTFTNVSAILSAPRYGPTGHFECANQSFAPMGIPYTVGKGAYWHINLSNELSRASKSGAEFIMTTDYDSYFTRHDVQELLRLMRAVPEIDAICPVQSGRGSETALFAIKGKAGREHETYFDRFVTRIHQGHFGLTVFRVSSLLKFAKPWMVGKPNADGEWEDGCIHPDIEFWKNFDAQGFSLFLASRVVIAHSDEVLMWPGRDFKPVFQTRKDYFENGIPAEVRRD